MNLTETERGDIVSVIEITRKVSRFKEAGITIGTVITVVAKDNESIIVEFFGNDLFIESGDAKYITVVKN